MNHGFCVSFPPRLLHLTAHAHTVILPSSSEKTHNLHWLGGDMSEYRELMIVAARQTLAPLPEHDRRLTLFDSGIGSSMHSPGVYMIWT